MEIYFSSQLFFEYTFQSLGSFDFLPARIAQVIENCIVTANSQPISGLGFYILIRPSNNAKSLPHDRLNLGSE